MESISQLTSLKLLVKWNTGHLTQDKRLDEGEELLPPQKENKVNLPFLLVSIPRDTKYYVEEDFAKRHILVSLNKAPSLYNENHVLKSINLLQEVNQDNVEESVGTYLFQALLKEKRDYWTPCKAIAWK